MLMKPSAAMAVRVDGLLRQAVLEACRLGLEPASGDGSDYGAVNAPRSGGRMGYASRERSPTETVSGTSGDGPLQRFLPQPWMIGMTVVRCLRSALNDAPHMTVSAQTPNAVSMRAKRPQLRAVKAVVQSAHASPTITSLAQSGTGRPQRLRPSANVALSYAILGVATL